MKKFTYGQILATALSALFVLIVSSCEKKASFLSPETSSKTEKYLEFKDFGDFAKTIRELNAKDSEGLISWEKSVNLRSLHRLYEQIMLHNIEAIEKAEAQIAKNPALAHNIKLEESPLLQQCKSMLVDTEQQGLQLNLFDPSYAKVLNSDGIVKIGGVLHKFGPDYIKTIVNGDYTLVKDLDRINKDTQTSNLQYIEVKVSTRPVKNGRVMGSDFSCSNENGGYRVDGWVWSYHYVSGNTLYGRPQFHYGAFMRSTHRRWSNIWGWVGRNTTIYRTYGNYRLRTVNANNWVSLPNATVISPFDYTNYNGSTSNATYYFIFDAIDLMPEGGTLQDIEVTLAGTFNFEFYDCACTASY